MKTERDIERDCIDDEGHDIVAYHEFKKCSKCGFTWFYKKQPLQDNEIAVQSTDLSTHLT